VIFAVTILSPLYMVRNWPFLPFITGHYQTHGAMHAPRSAIFVPRPRIFKWFVAQRPHTHRRSHANTPITVAVWPPVAKMSVMPKKCVVSISKTKRDRAMVTTKH